MAKHSIRGEKSDYGFKSHHEALNSAMKEYPPSLNVLRNHQMMLNQKFKTKDDWRWHVLFNLVFALARRMESDIDDWYLIEIQHNILLSAELYLE